MAFPIHPSRSDYDLMYSVLYDDFTAENAIQIINSLDKELPYPEPPEQDFKVIVNFKATTGGSLQGETGNRWVQVNTVPTDIPTPVSNQGYQFTNWTVNGVPVDPSTYKVSRDTTFIAEFEYVGVWITVNYTSGNNGHITGELTQTLQQGDKLTFPTTIPDNGYIFDGWYKNNVKINPATETAQSNATYQARFKVNTYTIGIYSVSPRTTNVNSDGISFTEQSIEPGDSCNSNWFGSNAGCIVNANGEYISNFSTEIPTGDTWYQKIDNSETISTSNNYYRKTFYAGRGGKLNQKGNQVYAYTAQASWWGGTSITTPTPVADSGWTFSHWIDLSNGNTANPDSNTFTTTKYAAIFVEN